ncbi:hypothetical protein [Calothrix sp. CCY 0018]|uniref:hypothetical protein n=1 Tax=Calothrix sp. CCY 0018 TaxID=3103864 RepID=UPI0039C647F9
MKQVLTVRSIIFNSLIVIVFAACGANAQKKAEICPQEDSEMLVPGSKFTENKTEDNSHPMFLPKDSSFEKESHPMVIPSCLKPEE